MAFRLSRHVPVSSEAQAPPEPPTKKPKITIDETAGTYPKADPCLLPVENAAQNLLAQSPERPISHADILNLWTLIPPNRRLRPKPSQVTNGTPESPRNMTYVILGQSPRTPDHLTNLSFALKSTIEVINKFIQSWTPGLSTPPSPLLQTATKDHIETSITLKAFRSSHASLRKKEEICGSITTKVETVQYNIMTKHCGVI